MSAFHEALNWRYATKKFDPTKKLTDAQLDELLEAARLAPTSYGLQPYRLIVIENPELRSSIKEKAWGQTQVTDASHLIVFTALKQIGEEYVDEYVSHIASQRGITAEALKGYRDMMASFVQGMPSDALGMWMQKQTYIALGVLLSAAAMAKIDACPMEGFDRNAVDEILGLATQNLTAVALCPVGYRSADDTAATYKKARFPMEELVIRK